MVLFEKKEREILLIHDYMDHISDVLFRRFIYNYFYWIKFSIAKNNVQYMVYLSRIMYNK